MDDRRRLLQDDDLSIPINPDVDDDDDGRGDVANAESSRILGVIDEEERYGTFQRRSAEPLSPPQPDRLDKTSRFRQTVSSLGFCLGALAMGNALGWSATAVPNLGWGFSTV